MSSVPVDSRPPQYDCKDIPTSDMDRSEAIVREKFAEWEDGGINVDILRAPLLCPIGKVRIKLPCRSVHCDHIQCFEASTYLKVEETSCNLTKWHCPICEKPATFENLRVDSLFRVVLRKTPSWCTSVQFNKDGSWTAVKSNQHRTEELIEKEIDDEIQILREIQCRNEINEKEIGDEIRVLHEVLYITEETVDIEIDEIQLLYEVVQCGAEETVEKEMDEIQLLCKVVQCGTADTVEEEIDDGKTDVFPIDSSEEQQIASCLLVVEKLLNDIVEKSIESDC